MCSSTQAFVILMTVICFPATQRCCRLKLLSAHMMLNFPPPQVGICHSEPLSPYIPSPCHHPVADTYKRLVCPDVYEFEDTLTYHFRSNVSISGCGTDTIVKFQETARQYREDNTVGGYAKGNLAWETSARFEPTVSIDTAKEQGEAVALK